MASTLPEWIQLPSDLSAKAAEVPGLPDRLLRFIRMEVALNDLRRQRYSPEALSLLHRAREKAEQRRTEGVDRTEGMRNFHSNYSAIIKEL